MRKDKKAEMREAKVSMKSTKNIGILRVSISTECCVSAQPLRESVDQPSAETI